MHPEGELDYPLVYSRRYKLFIKFKIKGQLCESQKAKERHRKPNTLESRDHSVRRPITQKSLRGSSEDPGQAVHSARPRRLL